MTASTVSYNIMAAGNKKIYTFRTTEHLARMLTKKIRNMVKDSIISGRSFNIALSGGSTPRILFEHIAKSYGDQEIWENVRFYWVDERCVPPDHQESNFRMVNEAFLRHLSHSGKHVFRMMGEVDPQAEADRYSRLIRNQLPLRENLPAFDLVLLGMGSDGHTASIFPDQMQLLLTDRLCKVAVHPGSGQKRITLTGKVINNADHIYFLVTGREKAKMVAGIIGGGPEQEKYPAAHIKPRRGTLEWFLDDAAASILQLLKHPGFHSFNN